MLSVCFSAYMLERRLSGLVMKISEQTVKANASLIISKTIYDELENSGVTYDSLIEFEKADDGKISALKTNIIEVNRLKSSISLEILERLRQDGEMTVKVPIGSILQNEMLSGRGPCIKVKIMPVGTVASDIQNVISSAGINQTRHQIMLHVNVHISIISVMRNTSTDISTNVCIAETVIVGSVPESYTKIDTYPEDGETGNDYVLSTDDIFNFVY